MSEIQANKRCTHCNYPLFPKGQEPTTAPPPIPGPAESSEAATTAVTEGMMPDIDTSNEQKEVDFEHHENTVSDKQGVDVKAGWLVVHMPDKETKTYDLYLGKNVIGRPTDSNDVDIPIEGDAFISRKHATILVAKDEADKVVCTLFDDGRESNGNPSTNGVFLNSSEERISPTDAIDLSNNDSIQIGETVMVFRSIYEDEDVVDAATAVMDMDFIKAIAIG